MVYDRDFEATLGLHSTLPRRHHKARLDMTNLVVPEELATLHRRWWCYAVPELDSQRKCAPVASTTGLRRLEPATDGVNLLGTKTLQAAIKPCEPSAIRTLLHTYGVWWYASGAHVRVAPELRLPRALYQMPSDAFKAVRQKMPAGAHADVDDMYGPAREVRFLQSAEGVSHSELCRRAPPPRCPADLPPATGHPAVQLCLRLRSSRAM